MNVETILESLELSKTQKKVFLFLAEFADSPVERIARGIDLKRTTVYTALEYLERAGLVETVQKSKKKHFRLVKTTSLIQELEKRKKEIEFKEENLRMLVPFLAAYLDEGGRKPTVHHYGGIEGIKALYKKTLEANEVMHSFLNIEASPVKEIREWIMNWYIHKRVKHHKIWAEVIVNNTKLGRWYQSKDKEKHRESVLVPHDKFPIDLEMVIWKGHVAIMSFKNDEMLGILIESDAISRTMKSIFKLIWEKWKDEGSTEAVKKKGKGQ